MIDNAYPIFNIPENFLPNKYKKEKEKKNTLKNVFQSFRDFQTKKIPQ